jgi:hypothetical protein
VYCLKKNLATLALSRRLAWTLDRAQRRATAVLERN